MLLEEPNLLKEFLILSQIYYLHILKFSIYFFKFQNYCHSNSFSSNLEMFNSILLYWKNKLNKESSLTNL